MDASVAKTPAEELCGKTMPSGWLVHERMALGQDSAGEELSGGFFSVPYKAEKDGKLAFLKAYDLLKVITAFSDPHDPGSAMRTLTDCLNAHRFEDEVLQVCSRMGFKRVVTAIDSGFYQPAAPSTVTPFPIVVPYLVFELAEGDIRRTVGTSNLIDDALRLRMLHHVAVGIQELHSERIAHQDLKPGNVLVFGSDSITMNGKVADLGRASQVGRPAPHDSAVPPGDRRHAPPEQQYGYLPSDWHDRREACDLYQLGALVAFVFSGTSVNIGLYRHLDPAFHPTNWRGQFADVLPHLSMAFSAYLFELAPHFPEWCREKLLNAVSQLCNPNVLERGHPDARSQAGRPLGLDRYLSLFDLLVGRAEINARSVV